MLLAWAATSHAAAWVLVADRPAQLRRATKAARGAKVVRAVPYGQRAVCLEVEQPSLRVRNRVERRLRRPVEGRSDCDWGWFPKGTGWVAVLLEPPVEGLQPALEALALPFYDLQVPSEGPIRFCVSANAVAESLLEKTLRDSGLQVRGVREVGACRRDP
ncbi:MAG: hypothetical protein AAGA48_07790 [Myxococcota bacterium]